MDNIYIYISYIYMYMYIYIYIYIGQCLSYCSPYIKKIHLDSLGWRTPNPQGNIGTQILKSSSHMFFLFIIYNTYIIYYLCTYGIRIQMDRAAKKAGRETNHPFMDLVCWRFPGGPWSNWNTHVTQFWALLLRVAVGDHRSSRIKPPGKSRRNNGGLKCLENSLMEIL